MPSKGVAEPGVAEHGNANFLLKHLAQGEGDAIGYPARANREVGLPQGSVAGSLTPWVTTIRLKRLHELADVTQDTR